MAAPLDPKVVAGLQRIESALDAEALQLKQMATDLRAGTDPDAIAAALEAHAVRIEALSDNLNAPTPAPVIPPEVPPTT